MEATLYTAQITRENAFGEFVMESITMEFARATFINLDAHVGVIEGDDLEIGMVQVDLSPAMETLLGEQGYLHFRGADTNWVLRVELP